MSSKPLALLGSEIVLDVLDFLESNNIREVFREGRGNGNEKDSTAATRQPQPYTPDPFHTESSVSPLLLARHRCLRATSAAPTHCQQLAVVSMHTYT